MLLIVKVCFIAICIYYLCYIHCKLKKISCFPWVVLWFINFLLYLYVLSFCTSSLACKWVKYFYLIRLIEYIELTEAGCKQCKTEIHCSLGTMPYCLIDESIFGICEWDGDCKWCLTIQSANYNSQLLWPLSQVTA